ncbi:glycoside hydrolase family 3 C-terminal domain-containing protein [Candidatus Leptofilum sp.]|uniref:glycoside hydrolase family 3 C-terminal domain-containing protein n=1 Tax=Candidatus Leptofilum sp. TaxID=3241576 RepID=UPI003B5B7E08
MEEKIEKLIKNMTLAEKASLLAGIDMWHTVAIKRLGIPSIQVSDGPNGVRGSDDNLGETSVCFPVGIAMGATWNPELIEQVGVRLASEVRRKRAHVLLAPTVNIHRTPIAGRNFECFAEDPYLSGTIAAAYINGLQKSGVAACIKHFVANDQEYERFSISAEVAERPLHEIYLEPFRIAKEQANPWTVMSAYNRVNGSHASENDTLLHEILKEHWSYDGLVMSDWYGTYSDGVPGGYLDLEMPGPARWMNVEKIVTAVQNGKLEEAHIDDKVRRLLRLIERVTANQPESAKPNNQLPRQVASESIVLLKNEGNVLPLDADQSQTIAVIGENGKWAQIMGGGSSQVNPDYIISPLEGIQQRAGERTKVEYTIGTLIHRMPPLLEPSWLQAKDGQTAGLTLSYYHNLELAGEPAHSGIATKSELSWFGTVNPFVDPTCFSLRLEGTMRVPETGEYTLHLRSIGRARLWVDGEIKVDNWQAEGEVDRNAAVSLPFSTDKPVSLAVEYITDPESPWRTMRLSCVPPIAADPIQAAVDLAAKADVAIIVAGLTREWESEGFDRENMTLPGEQNQLISRVAAANPRTVVVLNAGSPVEMPWLEAVPTVLQQWYGGQDAGNALADVLFGDVNPSAKLPTTFPKRLQDNPAYINYPGENGRVHYGEGIFVGYRYYDKKEIEPLFPFGHGLSYTTFAYSNARLNGESFSTGDPIELSVDVTNEGSRAGQEVVQVYVRDEAAKVERPLQELKAFAKVHLEPGETKTVRLTLTEQSLAYYDTAVHDWVTAPGKFELLIGSSSRDLRLGQQFTWLSGQSNKDAAPDTEQLSTVAT